MAELGWNAGRLTRHAPSTPAQLHSLRIADETVGSVLLRVTSGATPSAARPHNRPLQGSGRPRYLVTQEQTFREAT